jgi:hypothetical protein
MAYEFEEELAAHPELEEEHEAEFEEEMEDELGHEGEGWLGAIGNVVGSLLGEEEMEDEFEEEGEGELSPIRKVYPDAMMEHLGELAAEAETEDEAAEHFLPLIGMAASKLLPVVARAVGPMARRALPKIAHAVSAATPRLTKGIGTIAKHLYRNPATKHWVKTIPAIARRTVGTIAHQAARGRHITPRTATRILATQARRILTNPQHRTHALRRHGMLERRFHHRYHPGMVRPHSRYGWRTGGYGYGQPRARTYYGSQSPGAPAVYGTPGARRVKYGRIVGGKCTCPASGPQYCRCCGQLLR